MIELFIMLVCTFSSVVGSISGIGGGIIIRPTLEMVTPYNVELVSFLSGCAVLSMAFVALGRRKKSTEFDYRKGTMMAVGSVCGGLAGKFIFSALSGKTLGKVQALVLIGITFFLLVHLCLKKYIKPQNIHNPMICFLIGLVLGLVSAFLGIGGGPLNLAVLNYFLGLDLKKAAVYSLYIILFSQISSFLLMVILGTIPAFSWTVLACAVSGGIGGGFFGSWIGNRVQEKTVTFLYVSVLIFVLFVSGINLRSYIG